ncbi:lipid-binding SYLF domain-containing protein [Geomonas subterranea]|uniref:Lipid-binding SYLF domain-containing protein n=1 Tax=Geomonas subterranea TaxID=2847989 RepID=A0ABX8LLR4_9BACT|nr:lipid-binding SYLF domain-containing protein [Geomonas subterranea]QXE92976.1 lipid-binding SYLF domain-containing protein [Geomonas subterranea]QXM08917.1 lipid-binding SYLF domain-containing protein [Geomonas subterranea]
MSIARKISVGMVAMLLVACWAGAACAKGEAKKVQKSATVLQDIMKIPEKGIPPALLRDAKAVAIIPGVIKGAFVVGGRHGTGVLSVRKEDSSWSDPIFVSITGGSIGWQVGATSTDLILVFKELKDVDKLLQGKFTLGADAGVAAGPVGRKVEAATDITFKSGILSYSRSRGLFAGLSLEGAALQVDDQADAAYYGREIAAQDIMVGNAGKRIAASNRLRQELSRATQE